MHDLFNATRNGHNSWQSAQEYASENGLPYVDSQLEALDRTARRIAAEYGLSADAADRLPSAVWRRALDDMEPM